MWRVIARRNGRDLAVAGYQSEQAAREYAAAIIDKYELVRVIYTEERGFYDYGI